jgi:diguanylate cyclase (GGDEF)-like protein/PAS domain S-box-containing protein
MARKLFAAFRIRRYIPAIQAWSLVILYAGLFEVLHKRLGPGATALSVVPLIAFSWQYGMWGGLAAAALLSALNLYLVGAHDLDRAAGVFQSGGAGGFLALFGTAIIVGKVSKLQSDLKRELTERQKVEAELLQAKHYAEQIYQIAPSGMFTTNKDRAITSINREAAALLGYAPEELVGKPCTILTAGNCGEHCALLNQSVPKPVRNAECAIRKRSGEMLFISKNADLIWDAQGNILGCIESFVDITQRKQIEDQLLDWSYRDAMTGLYNRRYLDEKLRYLQQSDEYPITIFVVDLDHLKETNDTQGHQAGDQLILRAVKLMGTVFRSGDIIARIGGDEFAIVIPRTDAQAAHKIAWRFRQALRDANLCSKSSRAGLSFGWHCNTGQESLDQTLQLADRAMYLDKANKKHCGLCFQETAQHDRPMVYS